MNLERNKLIQNQICTKTVMDLINDPDITFDSNGISNHYWKFHKNIKPHWQNDEFGKKNLEDIVDQIKKTSKNKDFDCILGLSGGLDSSFMLHKLVKNFNLRPLVFHVDGGWNSEEATHNINSLVNKLNLDLFTEVINWEEMKNFQLAMFKSGVPHIDLPQDLAFIGVLYKFASKYKIKYILNGGNISTENVFSPLKILYWGTDMIHIRDILNQYGTIDMPTFPFTNIFYHKIWLRYFRNMQVIKPLNFLPYFKNEAIEELKKVYDWKPFKQKHFESRFTKFFEGYWLLKRFNYDMRKTFLSSLILTGQMDRDNALKILKESPLTPEEEKKEFEFVASKLDLSESELHRYQEIPKKYYFDYKNIEIIFRYGKKTLEFINRKPRESF